MRESGRAGQRVLHQWGRQAQGGDNDDDDDAGDYHAGDYDAGDDDDLHDDDDANDGGGRQGGKNYDECPTYNPSIPLWISLPYGVLSGYPFAMTPF